MNGKEYAAVADFENVGEFLTAIDDDVDLEELRGVLEDWYGYWEERLHVDVKTPGPHILRVMHWMHLTLGLGFELTADIGKRLNIRHDEGENGAISYSFDLEYMCNGLHFRYYDADYGERYIKPDENLGDDGDLISKFLADPEFALSEFITRLIVEYGMKFDDELMALARQDYLESVKTIEVDPKKFRLEWDHDTEKASLYFDVRDKTTFLSVDGNKLKGMTNLFDLDDDVDIGHVMNMALSWAKENEDQVLDFVARHQPSPKIS